MTSEPRMLPEPKLSWTIVHSVWMLAVPIGAFTIPESSQAMAVRAFGERPFGLPVVVVVGLAIALLWLPAPYFIWHTTRLAQLDEVKRAGSWYRKILSVDRTDPTIRHSHNVALAGLLYLSLLMVGWITFATLKGM